MIRSVSTSEFISSPDKIMKQKNNENEFVNQLQCTKTRKTSKSSIFHNFKNCWNRLNTSKLGWLKQTKTKKKKQNPINAQKQTAEVVKLVLEGMNLELTQIWRM